MKKILIIFIFIGHILYGQTTTNPDTVCINATGEQYFIVNTPASIYQWTVLGGGGILQTGQGTNSITVNWGATPGLYPNAVSVLETNSSNCSGIPVLLDVYILQMGLPNIGPFCDTDPTSILVGMPIGGTYSGVGVVGGVFDPVIAGSGVHAITYSLSGCSITINVTVNSGSITGPIQHF